MSEPNGIVGELKCVAGIMKESTGWVLKLDATIKTPSGEIAYIEVDPHNSPMGRFQNRHVKISGTTLVRKGLKRSSYPVIVLREIEEIS